MGVASTFLRDMFGPRSSAPVCIVSYANDKSQAQKFPPVELYTRDPDEIERFVKRYDKPGRAVYFGVNTVAPGKKRSKENIAEITALHADLDFKGIVEDRKQIEAVLAKLPLKLSRLVFSGNGLHPYWDLAGVTPELAGRVEAALKRLCWVLAGDPQVAEIARVMRLPGSHNSKDNAWKAVKVVTQSKASVYALEQLEQWLASIKEPLLHRVAPKTNGHADPYAATADDQMQRPSLDLDEVWDDLQFHGEDGNGVHATELKVSAALLNRGEPVEEIVAHIREQIEARIPESRSWNWKEEVRIIRRQCIGMIVKSPELLGKQENPPEWLLRDRRIKALLALEQPKAKSKALEYITGEALEQLDLEPVQWIVEGFIMRDVLNGMFGDGGTGKDYLLLQLAIAMATDQRWLGRDVASGKVLYFNVEDRVPRIRWRQHQITEYLRTKCADYPDRLRVVPLVGKNTILASFSSKSGLVEPTPMMTQVRSMIEDYRPDLVIMGNRVNIFGVNQNEDSQARQCIELLNAIGLDYATTLILPGHVSVRALGDESGTSASGSSGSVQWSNGPRHRLLLSKAKKDKDSDDDDSFKRTLTVLKSNDAPTDKVIELHWSQTHFLYVADDEDFQITPASVTPISTDEQRKNAENEFLRLLDKHAAKKENVSAAETARNNAPLLFSKDPDCKREYRGDKGKRLLRAAMDRLFAKGSIQSVDTGPASKRAPRIERVGLRVVKDTNPE